MRGYNRGFWPSLNVEMREAKKSFSEAVTVVRILKGWAGIHQADGEGVKRWHEAGVGAWVGLESKQPDKHLGAPWCSYEWLQWAGSIFGPWPAGKQSRRSGQIYPWKGLGRHSCQLSLSSSSQNSELTFLGFSSWVSPKLIRPVPWGWGR